MPRGRPRGSTSQGTLALSGVQSQPLRFAQKLVLHQWLLSQFGVEKFEDLKRLLLQPEDEGIDERGITRFYTRLLQLPLERPLSDEQLLAYDHNIVRHWRQITARRAATGQPLHLKYFQYLALLFTEVYLDRYCKDPFTLWLSLEQHRKAFNRGKLESDQIKDFEHAELNTLAFWMATGSGKTLLMHVNILQYQHYCAAHGQRPPERVLLLTPNEGLSKQHVEEFRLSGIDAALFSKDRTLFSERCVSVLEVTELRDELSELGAKTVAVEAFEGHNLVLVDEGHRGTSGAEVGAWLRRRKQLCAGGFSFEYSATFGQAIKASTNKTLTQTYAKSILFDYSYRYFYGDGYGKDYHILNLADDFEAETRRLYLLACLLTFYQQLKLYQERGGTFRPYLIERPLWMFVGGSVTANVVRSEGGRKVSDVVDILLFLADFVGNPAQSRERLKRLLQGTSGLLDPEQQDLFAGRFQYLHTLGMDAAQCFEDIVRVLFNAPSPAALHVELLKRAEGELALRLGTNPPFGVINVGDASALVKLCAEHAALVVEDQAFNDSLFRGLNDADSTINILIGAKKFSEGWSSWRVSTMGLMNVGRSEGPQIIQLFGRGVRLKGKGYSLKRSRALNESQTPQYLEALETLNIFGVRADYMRQFNEYLREEGVPTERIEFILPVVKTLARRTLKMLRLMRDVDFKRDTTVELDAVPPDYFLRHRVTLDWYPQVRAISSVEHAQRHEKIEQQLRDEHLAFIDWDHLYFAIHRHAQERGYSNLALPRGNVLALLKSTGWYRLLIPPEEMQPRSYAHVARWQSVTEALLKRYVDRYYAYRQREFEGRHLEYHELTEEDDNFVKEYQVQVERSREDVIANLEALCRLTREGRHEDWQFETLSSPSCDKHLYQRLLFASDTTVVEVKPVVLENTGERQFVTDLAAFCKQANGALEGRELYLLRNLARGRGIAFFEAGGFYPDFILWLCIDDHQHIAFIDPKGLVHMQERLEDPKVQFHQSIKDIEEKLGDPSVSLHSFIISPTPYEALLWGVSKDTLATHNILFQQDGAAYMEALIRALLLEPAAT
ncbi:MAG: hypothetical protein GEEBNDBF_01906 [bacterium]|nr:hypothetical protein [bacterium]